MSLCLINCEFKGYNSETKQAICECGIQSNLTLSVFLDTIINNNEEIINKFIDIKKTANLDIIKCYKLLFSKEGFINNICSYILLVILFLYFILSIIFCFKGFKEIKNKIFDIIKLKKMNEFKNNINKNKKKGDKKIKKKKKRSKKYNIKNIETGINLNKKRGKKIIKKNKKRSKKNINMKITKINNKRLNANFNKNIKFPPKKKRKIKIKINRNSITNNILILTNSNEGIISALNKNEIKLENKNKKIDKIFSNYQIFTDYEINIMPYEDALKYDKRTYFEYYFSLLRIKHLLLFSFYPNNDYNSKIIKIFFFFFSFALFYTINALFFNDSTMHIIYEENGIFNFIYQINQIIYSLIISSAITEIIKYLSLSEKNILKIKNEKNINNLDNVVKNELKCLKRKLIIFFIISFLFLLFFWYYLGCFGAVYKNTQIYLLKDTLISFGFSLIYPFILNLFPGILRIPSLKNKNKEIIYKISLYIQFIL